MQGESGNVCNTFDTVKNGNQLLFFVTPDDMLSRKIVNFDYQRSFNDKHANDIYRYLTENKNAYLPPIVLGQIKENETWYILDGQHRMDAYRRMYRTFTMFNIPVMLIIANSEETLKDIFYSLNQGMSAVIPSTVDFMTVSREVVQAIKADYPLVFMTSMKPRRPNLNETVLQNILVRTLETCSGISGQELVHRIKFLNDQAQSLDYKTFKYPGDKDQQLRRIHKLACHKKFVLGLYKEDEFVKVLRENSIPNPIYKRKQFTTEERRHIWNAEYGTDDFTEKPCIGCSRDIYFDDFDCAHIEPISKGGSNNLDNIRPLCRSCNRKCSDKNLNDFLQNCVS